jgi:hypothetical protein
MLEWGRGEILNLIALPLVMIGTFATTAAIPNPNLRKKLSIAILIIVIGDIGAVVWLIYRDYWPVASPPAPTTPPPTPTPKPSPVPFQPSQIQFLAVPTDEAAMRTKYCVVADFNGSLTAHEQSIDVTINEANLDLCLYSNHGTRRISVRVGIAASANAKARIFWTQPATVITPKLGPGETYSLSGPVHLVINRPRWNKLSQSVVFVEVANKPNDFGRENRYRLISENNDLTKN